MFQTRIDAGQQLATHLQGAEIPTPDLVVAAPRGGMPIGRVVADTFDVPLDIISAKKLTAPHDSDLSLGAISADGVEWMHEDILRDIQPPAEYLDRERKAARATATERERVYHELKDPEPVSEKVVVVVDDGIATGATMHACVAALRERGAATVLVAVPVGHPGSLGTLEVTADAVHAVHAPSDFESVGRYYEDFHQLLDDEAMSYLVF